MEVIRVENLFVKFTKEYYCLFNISFSVNKGENIAIIGDLESGKTTLIRSIAGLEKPYNGAIFINNTNVPTFDFKSNFQVGYLPCSPVFFENKTIKFNLEYVLKIRGYSKEIIDKKVTDILIKHNWLTISNKTVSTLSKFEKIQLAIMRFEIREIDLLLIDSYEENINIEEQKYIYKLLQKFYENDNCTVIKAVTSDYEKQYSSFRPLYLENGSLIQI